jgi:hypothetical protein
MITLEWKEQVESEDLKRAVRTLPANKNAQTKACSNQRTYGLVRLTRTEKCVAPFGTVMFRFVSKSAIVLFITAER